MKVSLTGATGMVSEGVLLAVRFGAPKNVLEVPDMRELAARE